MPHGSFSGNEEQKQDFISTLLAIGVFAIYSPVEVLATPQLQYPIINLMTQALQSDNDLVNTLFDPSPLSNPRS